MVQHYLLDLAMGLVNYREWQIICTLYAVCAIH